MGGAATLKGAAIRMAKELFDLAVPNRIVVLNKGSERGIMNLIKRKPHAVTLVASEFSQTFSKQRHLTNIEKFITQLLDHETYVDVTEMHDVQKLPDGYFFTIVGGSNLPWLRKLPSDALTGGFFARFFLANRERRRDIVATPDAADTTVKDRLVAAIRQTVAVKGEVSKSDAATSFYESYYEAHILAPKPTSEWQAYQNRRHNRVLMVGMLLAVSGGRATIELDDMRHAALIMDSLDRGVKEVFEELEMTRAGEVRRAVMDVVSRAVGGTTRDSLLRTLTKRYDRRDIEQQLDMLLQAGEVKRGAVAGKVGPKRYWLNRS
jgi:hypothetical protein